jgi:hypothetical protein
VSASLNESMLRYAVIMRTSGSRIRQRVTRTVANDDSIRVFLATDGGCSGDAEGENWDEPGGGGAAGVSASMASMMEW